MGSYYGGKPGNSFVIVKTFPSIAAMTEVFKLGPNYVDVNFDEYVLINTEYKNNPENGQIFRRGYDYNSTTRTITSYTFGRKDSKQIYANKEILAAGAEYVGTIVGPAGRASKLNFTGFTDKTFDDVKELSLPDDLGLALYPDDATIINKLNELDSQGKLPDLGDKTFYTVKIDVNENRGTGHIVEWHFYSKDATDVSAMGWFLTEYAPSYNEGAYTLENGNLEFGAHYKMTEDGQYDYKEDTDGTLHLQVDTYQDTIEWKSLSVMNEDHEAATAFIGFKMPIHVIEFEAEPVDAYYHRSDVNSGDGETISFNNVNLIAGPSAAEAAAHPFYSKWKVSIPKGIKGEGISNLRVETASSDLMVLDLDENGNLQYNEDNTMKLKSFVLEDADTKDRDIIVCDYTNYDRIPGGDTGLIYLGHYNMIVKDSVKIDDDGTFRANYTYEDEDVQDKLINWINSINLDTEGTLSITMNNDNEVFNEESGFVQNENTWTKEHLLDWIDNIEFKDDGTVTITMNNTSLFDNGVLTYPQLIKWLTDVSLNEETGQLDVKFNNQVGLQDFTKSLTWVKDIQTSEDGSITYIYTNKEDRVDEELATWITECNIDTITGVLTVTFNNQAKANAQNFTTDLRTVNRIDYTDDRKFQVTYNTTDAEGVSHTEDISPSLCFVACAPLETDKAVQELQTGGLWFVTTES